MEVDIIEYLIYLVGTLGLITILINIFILSKLGKSSLKVFGLQVLGLMLLFSIAGFLRSYHELFAGEVPDILIYLEYSIYTFTYIAAFYKLYQMAETYGFNVE